MRLLIILFLIVPGWVSQADVLSSIEFRDLSGKTYSSSEVFSKTAIVFLTGASCPISKRQLKTIDSLTRKYGAKYKVLLVETSQTPEAPLTSLKNRIQVMDQNLKLSRLLGAKTTTESFLLFNNQIIYRGAIENTYTLSGSKSRASRTYLENAIADFEAGREIQLKESTAFGCYLDDPENSAAPIFSASRFESEIKPILQTRCLNCHAEGRVTPDLSHTAALNQFKSTIRSLVDNNIMPPWPPVGGHWRNDLRLKDDEKAKLLEWTLARSDKALADQSIAPLPQESTDAGIEILEYELQPVKIAAHRFMGYQYFKLNLKNSEDMWVDMVRFQSRLKGSLHHAAALARPIDMDAKAGYDHEHSPYQHVGFYTSGLEYQPANTSNRAAILLPKNSTLYFQVHYEPTGKTQTDILKIIVPRLRQKPAYILQILSSIAKIEDIVIPPNTKDVKLELRKPLPADGEIQTVFAHMHYRGNRLLMSVEPKPQELLRIDRFNFKMQLLYQLEEPVKVKKGQIINTTAWFDNSNTNPDNPNPNQLVRGGRRATDEMLFGVYFLMSPVSEAESGFRSYWAGKPN